MYSGGEFLANIFYNLSAVNGPGCSHTNVSGSAQLAGKCDFHRRLKPIIQPVPISGPLCQTLNSRHMQPAEHL